MTSRLYYTDSYTQEFSAQVIEQTEVENHPAVILNETYFYPTGGGQPHDLGVINGVPVVDVITRESDHQVLHILEKDVKEQNVLCQIDWSRRFDHMQQHTAQHMLTQAFVQVAQANTVSFHLGIDYVSIDLDTLNISDDVIEQVESLVNQIIYENRPVEIKFIDPQNADSVRIRKIPDHLQTDGLRVIEVKDFDATACGGTHVAGTGEIGVIKVTRTEKRGDNTRVEFLAGNRALRDYRVKNAVIQRVASQLNCGYWEVDQTVDRLQETLKQSHKDLKALKKELIGYKADEMAKSARNDNGVRIIKAQLTDYEPDDLRLLATRLIEPKKTIALLGLSGEKSHFVFACSGDLSFNLNLLLQKAFDTLGGGRGGGRPDFVQGGGAPATETLVQSALDAAEQALALDGK
jgi:alanyl-tRNA synthetase